jgi:hypothetical protein
MEPGLVGVSVLWFAPRQLGQEPGRARLHTETFDMGIEGDYRWLLTCSSTLCPSIPSG